MNNKHNILNNICFNLNDSLKEHTVFLAWIFSPKAEHELDKLPLLFLLNTFLNKNIMNYEINDINITKINNIITINFFLLKETSIQIKVKKKSIILSFNKKTYTINYNSFFQKFLVNLYNISTKYAGKIIIRTFINESKLFQQNITNTSYKGEKGKEKLLNSPLSIQYNVSKRTLIDFSMEVIKQMGELLPYKKIICQHHKKPTIYGPIFTKHQFNTYGYKINHAKYIKPDILVMGSSRATPFQEKFFNNTFYNASLVMQSMNHGLQFLKDLFSTHHPKHIILCAEFWWFNNKTFKEVEYLPLLNDKEHFDYDSINKFFEYYHDDLINDSIIKDILEGNENGNSIYSTIGLRARSSLEGFFKDGYYFHVNSIIQNSVDNLQKDKKCQQYIDSSFFHFEKSINIDKKKLSIFFNIIDYCQEHNVTVTVLTTPLSKKIFTRLNEGIDYSYIKEFLDIMNKQSKFEFYNFLDPELINISQNEFRDCFHSGDIGYAKILKYLFDKTDSPLNKYVNNNYINQSIQKYTGKIVIDKEF